MQQLKGKRTTAPTRSLPRPQSDQVVGHWTPPTMIPTDLRAWGYFPAIAHWHPGDLILTSSEHPDRASQWIVEVQKDGYADHAHWTHAAVYLGDGLMLCEAQFDPPETSRVIVTPIWEYVGTHSIKVKRSCHALKVERGWAIATAAATNIGGKYDVGFVLDLARQALRGTTLIDAEMPSMSRKAFICSTLYSTAHAYVTDIDLTDKLNGSCLPAYLAGLYGRHLQDVPDRWLKIT